MALHQHNCWQRNCRQHHSTLQIVHVSGNHWVCVSNKHCAAGVCNIYMYVSMPASNSPTLIRQITAILKCSEPSFKVRYTNVHMQAGADDCGPRNLLCFLHRQNLNGVLVASKLQKILKSIVHAAEHGTGTSVCGPFTVCQMQTLASPKVYEHTYSCFN